MRTPAGRIGAIVVLLATAAGCHRQAAAPPPKSPDVFVPSNARDLRYDERLRDTGYTIDEPYPGPRFLCGLTTFMDERGWHALREDPLNPGMPSGALAGWLDGFTQSTKAPAALWISAWINASGDVLTYALSYPKPTATAPAPAPATVNVLDWPSAWVHAALASTGKEAHAAELPSLAFPLAREIVAHAPSCDETLASPLVEYVTHGTTPIVLPYELANVHAMTLMVDWSQHGLTLGERMHRLFAKNGLDISLDTGGDAQLAVTRACRCDIPGRLKDSYVQEAVLYRPGATRLSNDGSPLIPQEPKRILFHWSDRGDPAWKHVPTSCAGPQPTSPSCEEAYDHAEFAFADALASALLAARRHPQ